MKNTNGWNWSQYENILCLRPDNLGDILMTTPALRALKEQNPHRKLTLLASKMGIGITPFIPEIDDVIEFTVPWTQTSTEEWHTSEILNIIEKLKHRSFDAAIIFTVFSQNPLPSALLCYLAEIPRVLAYCRENPWQLVSHWVPDSEPFTPVQHEVERQLALVKKVVATTSDTHLSLKLPVGATTSAWNKLVTMGINPKEPWLILHPGVSETKRQYQADKIAAVARLIRERLKYQVLVTGTASERPLTDFVAREAGDSTFSLGGELSLTEYLGLLSQASLLITNNTGPSHMAAALGIPVVVLYALTNPQHTPWQVSQRVLYFPVAASQKNPDPILQAIEPAMKPLDQGYPSPEEVYAAVQELLAAA